VRQHREPHYDIFPMYGYQRRSLYDDTEDRAPSFPSFYNYVERLSAKQ